ncbi:hypothetical protein ABPG75_005713 [Micractinium tetrahymenae]
MAQPTEYELQREQRIQQNKRKMEEMGLLAASRGLAAAAASSSATVALAAGSEPAPRCKRRRAEAQPAALGPTRLSRRLRGEIAPSLDEAAAAARAEAEAEGRARARAAGTRKQLKLEEGQQLAAPFSLWSIGVTVWELGHVHRGAWAHRYWSSSGCLYHHAYPVGYRATKVQFGRTYEMRIEEGPTGPLFKVIDTQTGAVFSGASPTKPWTDVCIAHRTGQRISGPLFFGFSDPLMQRAIAVNLYDEAELRAALQGEQIECSSDSPEELAARDFCTVDGIGEATAIVLARSTALGGSRHGCLESLRGWAGASDKNAHALLDYLTGSEEVPESTRRWPAWRQRLAPRIVLALSGRWLGAGPAPQLGPAADAATEASGGPAAGAEEGAEAGEAAGAAARPEGGADVAPLAGDAAEPDGAAAVAVNAPAGTARLGGDCVAGSSRTQAACGSSKQQQEQQQLEHEDVVKQQEAAPVPPLPAASPAAAEAEVPQQQRAPAKENRSLHNSANPKPAVPAAKAHASTAAPAAAQRSRRERRTNSRLAEFLTGEAEACVEFVLE